MVFCGWHRSLGVDKFDGYTLSNFGLWGEDKSTGLQTLFALQIEASLDGQYLWVGTYSGLSRIDVDTESFKHYTLPASEPFNKQVIIGSRPPTMASFGLSLNETFTHTLQNQTV